VVLPVVLSISKWRWWSPPSIICPSVMSNWDRFYRLRVRVSKFLGFSRPESFVRRTPLSYSCAWRTLTSYLSIWFYCHSIFIIYYVFMMTQRWIIPNKLVSVFPSIII
jgi:hypothetical protein